MKSNSSASGNITGPGSSTDNAAVRFDGASGTVIQNSGVIIDDSNNVTGVASIVINNTGLKVKDTDASHNLVIIPGSNLTADRNLTLTTGDAARTLTINGNPIIDDYFDQSVKTTASPTFANVTDNGLTASRLLVSNGSKVISSSSVTDTEAGYLSGVTSAIQTQLNTIKANMTCGWRIGSETTTGITINDEAYYAIVVALAATTITGVEVYVSSVGGDPSKMRIALYDSAGTTRHAVRTTDATVSATGKFKIAFDATYDITEGTLYWVGVYADASNSTFIGTSSSPNSTNSNRIVTPTAGGIGATLPAGAATANRLCFNLY